MSSFLGFQVARPVEVRARRYIEHVGSTLGATIVHPMWQDALTNAQVIVGRTR